MPLFPDLRNDCPDVRLVCAFFLLETHHDQTPVDDHDRSHSDFDRSFRAEQFEGRPEREPLGAADRKIHVDTTDIQSLDHDVDAVAGLASVRLDPDPVRVDDYSGAAKHRHRQQPHQSELDGHERRQHQHVDGRSAAGYGQPVSRPIRRRPQAQTRPNRRRPRAIRRTPPRSGRTPSRMRPGEPGRIGPMFRSNSTTRSGPASANPSRT